MNREKFADKESAVVTATECNRHLLEQRVRSCRCWLSILRAAGRNRLLGEQHLALREIDAAMENALNRETGNTGPYFREADPWSLEKTELILTLIKHCLSELQCGHGLSLGSMIRLTNMQRAVSPAPISPDYDPPRTQGQD